MSTCACVNMCAYANEWTKASWPKEEQGTVVIRELRGCQSLENEEGVGQGRTGPY